MHRVAVIGATGYAGQELVRLLARHPGVELDAGDGVAGDQHAAASAGAGARSGTATCGRSISTGVAARRSGVSRVARSGLGRGRAGAARRRAARRRSLGRVSPPRRRGTRRDGIRPRLQCQPGVAYGLTEFEHAAIKHGSDSSRIPGVIRRRRCSRCCRWRSAGLIAPSSDVVIDAKSGISGAGKAPTDRTHFSENHGSVAAYGAFGHRHTPEMEQALGRTVTFVPHLVPLDRGILSSNYVRLRAGDDGSDRSRRRLTQAYASAPFVRAHGRRAARDQARRVVELLRHRLESRRGNGRALVVSVIDNLVKGAAGSAVQNFNVMCGLDECAGLL